MKNALLCKSILPNIHVVNKAFSVLFCHVISEYVYVLPVCGVIRYLGWVYTTRKGWK